MEIKTCLYRFLVRRDKEKKITKKKRKKRIFLWTKGNHQIVIRKSFKIVVVVKFIVNF